MKSLRDTKDTIRYSRQSKVKEVNYPALYPALYTRTCFLTLRDATWRKLEVETSQCLQWFAHFAQRDATWRKRHSSIKSQLLYQLSYRGIQEVQTIVRPSRFVNSPLENSRSVRGADPEPECPARFCRDSSSSVALGIRRIVKHFLADLLAARRSGPSVLDREKCATTFPARSVELPRMPTADPPRLRPALDDRSLV